MAVVIYPVGLRVRRQDGGQRRFDISFSNGDGGAQQTRALGPPRWRYSLVSEPGMPTAAAALWRATIMALRGRINQLEVYDLLNPAPAGTARGTWTANGGAAVGATSMAVSCGAGQAGKTILKGDWIGVNQSSSSARHLLHVQADVTLDGSGNGTVTFEPPLRNAVAGGSAVVWDKPTCLMRQMTSDSSWTSTTPYQGDFSLDLIESWE